MWDEAAWGRLAEMGWTGLIVPESQGGAAVGAVAAAALAEEMGRAAFPCPLGETLAATFVARASDTPAAATLLERIAGGLTTSLAVSGEGGAWAPARADVRATGITLDGVARYVQDARKVGSFLVSARSEEAACALDHETPEEALVRARLAKSRAGDAASYGSNRSVQLHGGIGFTWECAVQVYFKRQKHAEALLGDCVHHRRRLAETLFDA